MRNTEKTNNVETYCNTPLRKAKSAFTLVELIIVITILAILATIGFVSYQSYTLDSRDSKRKRDLRELRNGLEVYQIKNSILPDPDQQTVTIMSGGLTISVQGYAGTNVLQKLRANETKDTDANYYTYTVNSDKTKYQLLSLLEKDPSATAYNNAILNQTYARTDYTSRYPYTIGNKVGIFFSGTTNTPLQETTSGSLVLTDATNSTKLFKVIFGNSTTNSGTITQTGANLPSTIQTITNTTATTQTVNTPVVSNKFPGEDGISGTADDCDTDNITLSNGQVWSACNLGAKTAYNGANAGTFNPSGSTTRGGDDNVNGKLYQWGRNKGFASNDTTQQSTVLTSNPNGNDTYNFMWSASLASPYDWLSPQNNTIWGGQTTDSATVDNVTDKTLRQGACPTGWHVPSVKEWKDACDNISGTSCASNSTTVTAMQNTLKLPFAGYRYRNTGYYDFQSSNAYYWSSSPSSTTAYSLNFNASSINPANNSRRANGFSLRCLKN